MARKAAKPVETKPIVRISVPLTHDAWVKLVTLSAIKSMDRSVLAAEILTRAVSSVVASDRTKDSTTDTTDSPA